MRWTILGVPLLVMSSEYEPMTQVLLEVSRQKSTYPTKGYCGLHTELICHKYNETNALAQRNLSLCRCVFIFCDILSFYSVGCRSPPFGLNFYIFENSDWR